MSFQYNIMSIVTIGSRQAGSSPKELLEKMYPFIQLGMNLLH